MSTARRAKLTQGAIDRLIYDLGGPSRQILWDEALPAFGVRVYPSGRKSYVLHYGPSARRTLKAIALVTEITLKQARDKAAKLRVEIREGGDPLQRVRKAKAATIEARTVQQLAEDFLEAKVRSGAWGRAHTADSRRRMTAYVLPGLGKHQPAEITRADVNRLQIRLGESAGPVEANRVRSLVHHFLEWCREEETFPEDRRNPAAVSRTSAVKPYKETPRERWLHHEEAPSLFGAASEVASHSGDPYVAALVRLLLLTGLRKSELLARTWADVDLNRRTLYVPPVHKSGRPHTVFLSAYAVKLLRSLPRSLQADGPLFPNLRTGRARKDFKKVWRRVRDRAGLTGKANLTVHDLRRTAGSWLFQAGVPKDVIGRILQHTQGGVTDIYARLDDKTLRDAMERLGEVVRGLEAGVEEQDTQIRT